MFDGKYFFIMPTWLLFLLSANANLGPETLSLCKYTFTNPTYPTFTLPAAQPNSPGDVVLNPNNPIRFFNGQPLKTPCTSGKFSYQTVIGVFLSTYFDSNNRLSSIKNQFYVTTSGQLKVRTIQSNNANLGAFLAGRVLRLELTCNNGYPSCILFKVKPMTTTTIPTTGISTTASACGNGIKDQDETDIDCGGSICGDRCDFSQNCQDDVDCTDGLICQTVYNCPDYGTDCGISTSTCQNPPTSQCFSKDENVTMADFRSIPIGDVRTGDLVWTMSDDGAQMQLSEVMMVSHTAPDESGAFYTVETITGHRLSLTGSHYIRVQDYDYLQARKLSTNHSLYVMMNDRSIRLARIRSIKTESKIGVYNLFTLHGSYLVNGIAASSYINISYFSHQETHQIVAPLRWSYSLSKLFKGFQNVYPVEETVRQWLIKVLKSHFDTLVFLNHTRNILSTIGFVVLGTCALSIAHRFGSKKSFDNDLFVQKKVQ